MANIKSQIKRNRQNEARRLRNKSTKSGIKTAIKKAESAAASAEPDPDLARAAQAKVDIAVSKGVLHKKTAARRKSRLAKRLSSAG